MPKLKVHSGTKDRVRTTKNGKVLAGAQNNNHFKSKQSAARKRRLSGLRVLSGANGKKIKSRIGV